MNGLPSQLRFKLMMEQDTKTVQEFRKIVSKRLQTTSYYQLKRQQLQHCFAFSFKEQVIARANPLISIANTDRETVKTPKEVENKIQRTSSGLKKSHHIAASFDQKDIQTTIRVDAIIVHFEIIFLYHQTIIADVSAMAITIINAIRTRLLETNSVLTVVLIFFPVVKHETSENLRKILEPQYHSRKS